MDNVFRLLKAVPILAMVFLVACFPIANVKVDSPISMRLGNYQSVVVHVTTLIPDSSEQVSLLENRMVEEINKKAIFSQVAAYSSGQTENVDLRIEAKILELQKTGFVSLVPANINVEITLVAAKTDKTIGVFKCSKFTSGSTTKGVIYDVAKRTAQYLKENM